MEKSVLIIEDSQDIADLISIHLHDLGMDTICAIDGKEGYQLALSTPYDLIILDLMLPSMDGVEICKRLRTEKVQTPILMLTAKSEELDIVLGLEVGADDYMIKPFSVREMIARVKAIFRRIESTTEILTNKDKNPILIFGKLMIDLEKRKVLLDKNLIDLTVKEFDMLQLFASHPGKCYSRQQLLDEIWGYQFDGYDHTVNSHINRLRSKIEEDRSHPFYIQTVWGVGYKFVEAELVE